MERPPNTLMHLENETAHLTIDLYGGAVTNFQLKNNLINPLSFAFTKEQMPANNKKGAPYKGHFLCLGRWGLPSEGEIKAGIPNHGEAANILWQLKANDKHNMHMQAEAILEGLHIDRLLILDKREPVMVVKETVRNINPLGRLFNIVQHPTLAEPFLNEDTVVDCNGSIGFNQALYKHADNNVLHWPYAKDNEQNDIDLRSTKTEYNAVFSFIVQPESAYGWITAYSPLHQLLIGYIWKREDYPWIHLWQHWNHGAIQYRGIEFGTAGIHQPFKEIVDTGVKLFKEKTLAYIDANETIAKSYLCFLHQVEKGFSGIDEIDIGHNGLQIKLKDQQEIIIKLTNSLLHELF